VISPKRGIVQNASRVDIQIIQVHLLAHFVQLGSRIPCGVATAPMIAKNAVTMITLWLVRLPVIINITRAHGAQLPVKML